MDITPGSKIQVTIVRHPTNEAARKTLVRVLSKDRDAKLELRRLQKLRKWNHVPKARGGRLWGGFHVKVDRLKGERGEKGTFFASVDIIRDLRSVERFIDVKPA